MLTQNKNPHCTFSKLLARRPSGSTTTDLPKLSIADKVSIINPEMINKEGGGGGEGLSKIKTIERFRSIKTRFPTPYPEKKSWLSDEEEVVRSPIK
jgi:hypothetical protein